MNARTHHTSYRNGSRVSASHILLQPPHVKLRVALVCLVWGEEFADFFARYCVRSLLEPHNIPLLSREQEVTLLVYTDGPTREFLERCESFNALSKFVQVEVLPLEQLPAAARTNHWVPWQHAVAGRSRDFDLFLVIIPDCVYAAGCLGTIVDALREHDSVYYRLPQVCKETVAVELDGLRRTEGHSYIGFTSRQAVELFIRHVNPKHAAAACSGAYFINHPEYALQLSPESMVVSETASHPLAIRSNANDVSYTFGAFSPGAKACHLEILGVSAEPALKFVEQYYRWPKLHREHSRLMNLGSWAWTFRDASNAAYAKSATHIALDQGRALEQHRGQLTRAKTQFVNARLDYLAVAVRVYEHARQCLDATVARYIALAIATPGFQRRLRRLPSDLTVVLPKAGSRLEKVVQRIERHPAAQELLRRFLLLHVVASRLAIVPGHAVSLTYSDAAFHVAKAFVVDPNSGTLGDGLWGKALSPLQWIWGNTFCVEADIDYSRLTWAMLDPVHGTSERILDQPRAIGSIGLDPDQKALSGLWLSPEFTGRNNPILRFAKRKAPGLYAIAGKVYRGLRRRGAARPSSARGQFSPIQGARSNYDAISKLNIIDNVASITLAFYARLGLSPQHSPVCECLAGIRSKLAEEVEAFGPVSAECSLKRFELAWRAYAAGEPNAALPMFREVIADERLARASASDARSREAFIRAAEILGHHAELRGDADAADQLYRRILKLGGNGIVARRLLLILWRQGRLREAAEVAPRVMQSDANLAQHLLGSDAVRDLTHWIKCEVRRNTTTARGQHAQDFGQVG
jgi:hypothetical protein